MSIVKDMAILMQRWREQPMLFMKQVLNVKQLWSMQSDLCNCLNRAIAENKPIYVASGNGLGKDVICSMVALWFLICFNKSKVILTAPSSRQVEKIMYGYVKKNWDDRNFKDIIKGIPYTSPRIDIDPKDHYLMGFTTKESSGSAGSRFRGIHSDNMCVIVSEAQGIEPQIFDQIKAITTGKNNLVIYIGNPTRAVGDFAKGLKNKTDNIVFNVSCMDNPNYKQRTVVIPGLTTYEWVENRRKDWGETDARWQANVLGQIPDSSINTVLSQDLININIRAYVQ